ncbi:MAG: creatininase family protein [Proteobacteria bacterium]|nr:creatininase family protein [Pseudomonadota bacterium]
MRIDRVPYTAVARYLKKNDTILIPLGSCEQQGPHLPMGAETLIVDAVATAAGERTGFAVTPALPVNYAHLFRHYPGVLSAGLESYTGQLRDICEGLVRQGFRHVFFVNIHFGSLAPIEAVARALRERYADALFAHCDCFQLMREVSDAPVATKVSPYAHGSERTTSMILHIAPGLVDLKAARIGKPKPLGNGFEVLSSARAKYKGSSIGLYVNQEDYNPMGSTGDPTHATPEMGKKIFEDVVAYVADAATAFSRTRLAKTPRRGARR